MEGTFYRRELPSPAISFSSEEGKQIFKESLLEGFMEAYFHLAEQYSTQGHPAFCGIGSLTVALNSLLVDPKRIWKGVWRWFDESMLDCCQPIEVTKVKGITLPKLACLARCNGATADLHHASNLTVEEFRNIIKDSCSKNFNNGKGSVVIVSYSRATLHQSGSGHFSPIGGYSESKDLVLIMDVARFKYSPHWVPLPLLFEAMLSIDPDTNLTRGLIVVSTNSELNEKWFSYDLADCCTLLENENNNSLQLPLPPDSNSTSINSSLSLPPTEQQQVNPIQFLCEHNCINCSCLGNSAST